MPFLQRISTEVEKFRARLSGAPVKSASREDPGYPLGLNRWELRDLMLSGKLYLPENRGGNLAGVLRLLNRPSATTDEAKNPIQGYYNPARQIVSFYDNALSGQWGKDLTPKTLDGDDVAPAVRDALDRLWRWSNLETSRSELVELAANQGTVGIRVVFQAGETDARTFLQFDHPSRIIDAEEDARGNVREVLLEYDLSYSPGLGGDESTVKVREIIGADRHSLEVEGRELLTPEQRENPLGVCPYVLLRHEKDTRPHPDGFFGRHAYWGSETAINGINWGLSNLDESVVAHVWPYLFASGAGNAPQRFTTGKYSLIYAKSAAGVPASTFEPMVPGLNFGGALEHFKWCADLLRDRQPELALSNLSLLSGLSGETLAQVLKPAEAACLKARRRYEDALVRALQIGLSIGVLNRQWDLGTGTGTKEAADRAYDDGQGPEAFAFAERPALPLTPFSAMNDVKARTAERTQGIADARAADGVVSRREQLRIIGYDDAEIEEILRQRAEEDVLPEVEEEAAEDAE